MNKNILILKINYGKNNKQYGRKHVYSRIYKIRQNHKSIILEKIIGNSYRLINDDSFINIMSDAIFKNTTLLG